MPRVTSSGLPKDQWPHRQARSCRPWGRWFPVPTLPTCGVRGRLPNTLSLPAMGTNSKSVERKASRRPSPFTQPTVAKTEATPAPDPTLVAMSARPHQSHRTASWQT